MTIGDNIRITCTSASIHGGRNQWVDEVLGVDGEWIMISQHYRDRVPDEVYRRDVMAIRPRDGYKIEAIT